MLPAEVVGAAIGAVAVDEPANVYIGWSVLHPGNPRLEVLHELTGTCLCSLPSYFNQRIPAFTSADAALCQLNREIVKTRKPRRQDEAIDGTRCHGPAGTSIVERIFEKYRVSPHQPLFRAKERRIDRLRGTIVRVNAVQREPPVAQKDIDVRKGFLSAIDLKKLDFANHRHAALIKHAACAEENLVLAALGIELDNLAEGQTGQRGRKHHLVERAGIDFGDTIDLKAARAISLDEPRVRLEKGGVGRNLRDIQGATPCGRFPPGLPNNFHR